MKSPSREKSIGTVRDSEAGSALETKLISVTIARMPRGTGELVILRLESATSAMILD